MKELWGEIDEVVSEWLRVDIRPMPIFGPRLRGLYIFHKYQLAPVDEHEDLEIWEPRR